MGGFGCPRRIVLVAAMLLVACGPRPASSGGLSRPAVIPWISTPAGAQPTPSPTPLPTALAMRYCQARDLNLRAGRTGAAAGTAYTTFVFTNRSSTPCQLQGVPLVQLLDASGQPLARSQPDQPWGDQNPVPLLTGITDGGGIEPAVAGQAQLTVGIASVLCMPRHSSTLLFGLPNGGGQLRVAWARSAYRGLDCAASPLVVWPFADALPHSPPPEAPPDFMVETVLPASVAIGQTLQYEVRLTNVAGHDIAFANCPGYTEVIKGETLLVGRYVLNCRPVGLFRSGETVTFAIEFPIVIRPRTDNWIRPGPSSFRWVLDWPFRVKYSGSSQITLTAS